MGEGVGHLDAKRAATELQHLHRYQSMLRTLTLKLTLADHMRLPQGVTERALRLRDENDSAVT